MSAGGFVAAIATTVALFGLFYAEVRHQRTVARREARAAFRSSMAVLTKAFDDLARVFGQQLTPALRECAHSFARFGEAWSGATRYEEEN